MTSHVYNEWAIVQEKQLAVLRHKAECWDYMERNHASVLAMCAYRYRSVCGIDSHNLNILIHAAIQAEKAGETPTAPRQKGEQHAN